MSNTPQNIIAEGETPEALSRLEALQAKLAEIKNSAAETATEMTKTKLGRIIGAGILSASVGVTAAVAEESTDSRKTLMDAVNAERGAVSTILNQPTSFTGGEYQVAAVNTDENALPVLSGQEVSTEVDESAWLNDISPSEDVANFLLPRVDDRVFDFIRDDLVTFSKLSPEMQEYLVQAHYGIGGLSDEEGNIVDPLEPEDKVILGNLRVPRGLYDEILSHVIENQGISRERIVVLDELVSQEKLSRAAVKGFSKAEVAYIRVARTLNKLSLNGDLSAREMKLIEKYAGELYNAIPIVIELEIATNGAEAAIARMLGAEESLEVARVDAAEARAEAQRQAERAHLAQKLAVAMSELHEHMLN